MRKEIVYILFSILLVFYACKEQSVTLNPGGGSSNTGGDSSTLPRNVLVEEYTGASCPNCPSGHEIMAALRAQYGTRLQVIAVHPMDLNFLQAKPEPGHTYDFRSVIGYTMQRAIYGSLSFMPSVGIDRLQYGGPLLDPSGIGDIISSEMADTTGTVYLSVSSSFNATTDSAKIQATVIWVKGDSSNKNLSIALVEDSLVDIQDSLTILVPNYVFNNVFRDLITDNSQVEGIRLLPNATSISKGTVDLVTIPYKVNIGVINGDNHVVNPRRCRVIAYITNRNTHKVVQSAECPLVQ
jgi:hypothetical protein